MVLCRTLRTRHICETGDRASLREMEEIYVSENSEGKNIQHITQTKVTNGVVPGLSKETEPMTGVPEWVTAMVERRLLRKTT